MKKDYPGFISLVNGHNPHQVTLVPDADGQITSDHGWKIEQLDSIFKSEVSKFKKNINHVSIFIDDDFSNFDKLSEIGINSVEIYTGPFAEVIKDGKKHEIHSAQNKISKIVESAKLNNLKGQISNKVSVISKEDKFFNSPVYTNLKHFKEEADLILCNRNSFELKDVQDKIFTRDIFQQD